ncbi:transposase IS3/IS911 family protein [Paenibacillus larvae subsp. larvae]|uniref:Transposase IS3/IS911 family protein n=1 Tax=Paenibacillus larvae subsp. larvae TaxID=147375 RepID=A0A2L1TZ54_9BACL|nr:transposase [Paenibacillus larvae]AVF25960.1 transposase IS3/IS911 family protein [Paenibacillus larvae subsp. larvae]AVF30737.1 transposase IS3/IS911 family protein [Paenibacillus larvae subsp. larvae]MCY9502748.1 transposase [Paenibacillus larvae]MCY9681411.1 transposase [Paenibacillus larvae]MCY9749789.1 transposase [Paenibacillus larvae]
MRRTKYSNEFKVQVVKEALETRNKAAVADVTSLPPICYIDG